VIHDNAEFAPYVGPCSRWAPWNGYWCQKSKLGVLLFESQDPDTMDRSVQPIYVQLQGTAMNNKLNSFMDHGWDGFYTSQKRLSRFPTIIDGEPGMVYNLTYTGTPPKKQRFVLRAKNPDAGMTIRIHYPSAESRNLVKDGKIVEFNQWSEIEKQYGSIKQERCGENRYIGIKNIFEFYIDSECEI
jgi:hypothetical protein